VVREGSCKQWFRKRDLFLPHSFPQTKFQEFTFRQAMASDMPRLARVQGTSHHGNLVCCKNRAVKNNPQCRRIEAMAAPLFASGSVTVERKNHTHLCLHFHGRSIQYVWFVSPLPNGVDRGRDQERMAADGVQLGNPALRIDERSKEHRSLSLGDDRVPRIYRLHFLYEESRVKMRDFQRCMSRCRNDRRDMGSDGIHQIPHRCIVRGRSNWCADNAVPG